ncbi:MAG: hypothetical protein MRY83_05485 [Flavobacteriales bacterium]|nr:hypothetical protein [Flavobacteriales bacterium]
MRHLISFDATGIDFNFKKYADSILSIFYSDRFHEDGGFVLHETQRTNINAVNKELPQELSGKYDMLNKGLPFELEQDDQYSLEQIELGLKNSDDVEWLEDDKLNISIGGFPFFFQGDETPIVEKKRAHFIMQFDLTHHEIFELMFGGDYAVFLFSDDNGNIISVGQQ